MCCHHIVFQKKNLLPANVLHVRFCLRSQQEEITQVKAQYVALSTKARGEAERLHALESQQHLTTANTNSGAEPAPPVITDTAIPQHHSNHHSEDDSTEVRHTEDDSTEVRHT